MSDYEDYIEEDKTFVKFSARPAVRWNSDEWGVYIFTDDGSNTSEGGVMFSVEQAERAIGIIRHAIEMAKTKPLPDLLPEDEEF